MGMSSNLDKLCYEGVKPGQITVICTRDICRPKTEYLRELMKDSKKTAFVWFDEVNELTEEQIKELREQSELLEINTRSINTLESHFKELPCKHKRSRDKGKKRKPWETY